MLLGDCFDADDDHSRICASITPDTVLYTLFRGKIQINKLCLVEEKEKSTGNNNTLR